jgi:hypothetical protein
MRAIARRLCKLELHRREGALAVAAKGDARRLLEKRLDSMSRRLLGEGDRDEFAEPELSVEEVTAMIHAHLEETRIRREDDEKQLAARWPMGRYPAYRF